MSNEPQPPLLTTPQNELWGHCIFFGKAGTDSLGQYVSTPNSWGARVKDSLHPDGWQKLRQNYFDNNYQFLFNPWTLIDKIIKPNNNNMTFKQIKGQSNVYACNDITKVRSLINDMPTLQGFYELTGENSFTVVDNLNDYTDCSMKSQLGLDRVIN